METLKGKLEQYMVDHVQGLAEKERQSEGAGSYGTVYRVTVNGVTRIAKQLHEMLISDVSSEERESILQRFHEECYLLSTLHHPNVVEFIGVHFGEECKDVSLIMEHMHTDLDRFIDKKKHPVIPISIKASILLDISYGLLYLHLKTPKPIIHRDLTARNILLTKDLRAKIADLGVAKLLNIEPNSPVAQTVCPGTHAYMPPEALKPSPCYGTELDIFSFGHLALCVAVQEVAQVYDISNCDRVTLVDHAQRDQLHILKRKVWIDSLRSPDSALRELIISCLMDKPEARLTTQTVSNVMKVLSDRFPKTPSDFAAVWDQFERAALEKSVPKDVETIEVLRHQIEELNAAKEALQIETDKLKEEKATNEKIFQGLKSSHALVASELNMLTEELLTLQIETDKLKEEKETNEKIFQGLKSSHALVASELNMLTEELVKMQRGLSISHQKLEKSEIALLNEYSEHDITKATLGEAREMFLTLISKMDKKLEHVLRERTRLDDLLTTTREEDGSTKEPKKMRRKRSKSDVSGEAMRRELAVSRQVMYASDDKLSGKKTLDKTPLSPLAKLQNRSKTLPLSTDDMYAMMSKSINDDESFTTGCGFATEDLQDSEKNQNRKPSSETTTSPDHQNEQTV